MFFSMFSQMKQCSCRAWTAATIFLAGTLPWGNTSSRTVASRLSKISATESRLPRARIWLKCSVQKPRRFVSTRTSGSIMAAPVM